MSLQAKISLEEEKLNAERWMRNAVLFDFDGVVADTEQQYDQFWASLERLYPASVPNIVDHVRGVTLHDMLIRFFNHYPRTVWDEIIEMVRDFELQMDYPFIPGADCFIRYLKERHVPIALVTSSGSEKMHYALKVMKLEDTFDAIVSADMITRGKPDPMCYLLGAEKLGVPIAHCTVFEDSLPGVTAGKTAGARVVALTTTSPEAELRKLTEYVIPDFSDLQEVLSLMDK